MNILKYVKNQYNRKLRYLKEELPDKWIPIIKWEEAELKIVDEFNFHGDVHIPLSKNLSLKDFYELMDEVSDILAENKVGLYMDYEEYRDGYNEDELKKEVYFDEGENCELVFYNKNLVRKCKNYVIEDYIKILKINKQITEKISMNSK